MTLSYGFDQIAKLKELEGDPEAAHSFEDKLLWELVAFARDGAFTAAHDLAQALDAYDRNNPDRTRWCA